MSDTSNGMDLLLNKLLPMVVQRLKALEEKVAALEAPKPKRVRTKKVEVAKPDNSKRKTYPVTPEQVQKIHELYQSSVGVDFENMEVLTDEDGTNLTVNEAPITSALVDSIKKLVDEKPAATVQDICLELKQPAIAVCFVMVMFNL